MVFKNSRVLAAVNSGPPSDESSSGMPYVTNDLRRQSIRLVAPPEVCSTMGQLEYMSTITRKKSAHTHWKGYTGDFAGLGGALG